MLSASFLALSSLAVAANASFHGASSAAAFASFPTHSVSNNNALHHHAYHSSSPRLLARLHMATSSKTQATVAEMESESERLREEIAELRKEALRRLEALNEKLGSTSSLSIEPAIDKIPDATGEGLLPAPAPIVFTESKSKSTFKKKASKGIANLLDQTRWKISFSIGREPGTWMPSDWGKSGQRINVSFIAEFTPSQLFDRDDFLHGGYSNSKILHVIGSEVKLGPSLSEGQRVYKVKDGGWQVTRGDGPMGTDLLRFFIELDEQIAHADGDVYVPKGRVYSSCGYFPFMGNDGDTPSVKEAFTKEMEVIEDQIIKLQEKKDKDHSNPFDLEGFKISQEIFRLNRQAERVNNQINFSMVREPDKSLLRFSKDEDVGLTKEGGVCCQVNKGPVVEYHILGRFSIASIELD